METKPMQWIEPAWKVLPRVVPHATTEALEADDVQRAAWLAERIAEAQPSVGVHG